MNERTTVFRPLRPMRNLSEQLVERLTGEIASGKLAPGERLPTEQSMIASFGVSRTVVREAISALRAVGLVESRQGSGIFIAKDLRSRPFLIDPGGLTSISDVVEVMELRISVEVEAAALAAERHTPAQFERISAALAAFDEAMQRGEAAVDEDLAIHTAVAEATGNGHFPAFLQFLGRHLIPRQSIRVGLWSGGEQRHYLEGVQVEHRAIADAIRARDPAAARDAMRQHLSRGRERYRRFATAAGET
jgi:DNA-binding FadR family transcriptional regulator